MLKSKLVVVSSVVMLAGLLGAAAAARANASHTNYLTFSAPFALPGIALPAGTYIFEVVSPGSYDVVRVMSRDGQQVYLTAFTSRVQRPRGLRADRQILFNEVRSGVTPAVKAWFPVGESIGHEFLYPAGSRQLADATN
jgi:hypothetical protein